MTAGGQAGIHKEGGKQAKAGLRNPNTASLLRTCTSFPVSFLLSAAFHLASYSLPPYSLHASNPVVQPPAGQRIIVSQS